MPSVFGSLNENGYFYDPVERGKLCIILFIIHTLYILLPIALSGKHNHKKNLWTFKSLGGVREALF